MALIGVYGGTFDPIHDGHLCVIDTLATLCDRVKIIPNACPPHRSQPQTAYEHRCAMVKKVLPSNKCTIELIESNTKQPSYTVNTLQHLKEQANNDSFAFALGLDAFLDFGSWYQPEKIMRLANLVLFAREHTLSDEAIGKAAELIKKYSPTEDTLSTSKNDLAINTHGMVYLAPVVPPPISSTTIRASVNKSPKVPSGLPLPVWQYIKDNRLYQ